MKTNKYHPFKDKADLQSWIDVLDSKKPENKMEAIMMVLAKWHRENPERGEVGDCGACELYLYHSSVTHPDCTKCFMFIDETSCYNNGHPFDLWIDSVDDEEGDKHADQIFAIALKAWEEEKGK
jgi:hypothetical protein